jgi:RNA polymerase sigma-70 factor (ECF subfamily)
MRMTRNEFEAAVATYGRRVFTLAVYLLGDPQEAEDVAQEVLIRLWRRGHAVDPQRMGAWLLQVTRNACVDLIRKRRRGEATLGETDAAGIDNLREPSPDPERLFRATRLGEQIRRALGDLTEPHRSVVILREIQGLSYREISEVLEMPLSSVRVNLHRGRRRLREELGGVRDHVAAC